MNQNERMLPGDPQKKPYMSDQEFTAHMEELISTPNAEANHNLLDLANSLWFELKEDLYHTFSFISRHFKNRVSFPCSRTVQLPMELIVSGLCGVDRIWSSFHSAFHSSFLVSGGGVPVWR